MVGLILTTVFSIFTHILYLVVGSWRNVLSAIHTGTCSQLGPSLVIVISLTPILRIAHVPTTSPAHQLATNITFLLICGAGDIALFAPPLPILSEALPEHPRSYIASTIGTGHYLSLIATPSLPMSESGLPL